MAELTVVERLVADLLACRQLDPRTAAEPLQRNCERLRTMLGVPSFARPGIYRRMLLHRCSRFELLLLDWGEGAQSAIHDHGGQSCTVLVLDGAVDIDDFIYEGAGSNHARLSHVRTSDQLGSGMLDARRDDANAIHRVRTSTGARTLHVYAAPIDTCGMYDLLTHARTERALHYDACRL